MSGHVTSGVELPEAACEGRAPRKQWAAGPSRSVMQVLGNADPVLGDSACSSLAGSTQEPGAEGQRRRWDKEPPERLLSLLEKVQLSRASSTFVICRGGGNIYILNRKNSILYNIFLARDLPQV